MPRSTTPEAAPAVAATDQFVVTVGAVTLATGRKKDNGRPEVVRIPKGGIINAPASHPSIVQLLASKSVAPYVEGQPVRASTARMVVRAMGTEADPVAAPREDVQPLPAPAGA